MVTIATAQYPITFFENIDQWKVHTRNWVQEAAQVKKAEYLLFPEYGSMELTSLVPEDIRKDLSKQAKQLAQYLPVFIETYKNLAIEFSCYIMAPSFPYFHSETRTTNRTFVFSPKGQQDFQDKLFMTRFEDEQWHVQSGEPVIKIFQTPKCNFAISTCFDIEFAAVANTAALAGADLIMAPSCTETIKGSNRVHIGARARALETQNYVVVSQTVGSAPWSVAVDENNGLAAIYSTADVGFTDDGVVVVGQRNQPSWVAMDLDLNKQNDVRQNGAVFNYKKHAQFLATKTAAFEVKKVSL